MRDVSVPTKAANHWNRPASWAILIVGYTLASLTLTEFRLSTSTTVNSSSEGIPSSLNDYTYSSSAAESLITGLSRTQPSILQRPVSWGVHHATAQRHYSSLTRPALKADANLPGRPPKRPGRPAMWDVLDDLDHEFLTSAQFLLDFAIIGNGKCGTTSLQIWLAHHPEIVCPEREILHLSMKTVKEFIAKLYMELPSSSWIPPSPPLPPSSEDTISIGTNASTAPLLVPIHSRGYKNPGEIRVPRAIRALATHFPKTVLIVGIRHPVLWFQSLYNFKVQNLPTNKPTTYWGHPNDLIGKCGDPMDFNCVGTYKGLFHLYLAYLGKTERTGELRKQYPDVWTDNSVTMTPNPVFLFDVQQLHESVLMAAAPLTTTTTTTSTTTAEQSSNISSSTASHDSGGKNTSPASYLRGLQFRRDVQAILGLERPLGPPPRMKPGKVWANQTLQKERDQQKIDICRDEFAKLRTHLMEISQRASTWIRSSGFLDAPTVHVSSRVYLEEDILAKQWMSDPCGSSSSSSILSEGGMVG